MTITQTNVATAAQAASAGASASGGGEGGLGAVEWTGIAGAAIAGGVFGYRELAEECARPDPVLTAGPIVGSALIRAGIQGSTEFNLFFDDRVQSDGPDTYIVTSDWGDGTSVRVDFKYRPNFNAAGL